MITDKMLSEMIGITSPWSISQSKFDMKKKTLEIHVECASKYWVDDDGNRLTIHGYEERRWRHLNMFEFTTWITARIPRLKVASPKVNDDDEQQVDDSNDGAARETAAETGPKSKTMLMPVPWAEPYVRFTRNLELFIIEVLRACKTVKEAAGLLHLSWDEVDGVMQRAVKRGLMRRIEEPIEYLCIDEKSFGKGHSYATIVADSGRKRVLEVGDGRTTEKASQTIVSCTSEKQRKGVKAISMDMSPSFIATAHGLLPNADIVFDHFHVSKLLNEAVDKIRKETHKQNMLRGDDSLKGTKYDWLMNPDSMDESRLAKFLKAFEANAVVGKAWTEKENFASFWECQNREEAGTFFETWYRRVKRRKGLAPMKKVAETLKKHLYGLLAYMDHRISNGYAEGLNSLISILKTAARGFRNKERFRTCVLFHHGKLDMLPA